MKVNINVSFFLLYHFDGICVIHNIGSHPHANLSSKCPHFDGKDESDLSTVIQKFSSSCLHVNRRAALINDWSETAHSFTTSLRVTVAYEHLRACRKGPLSLCSQVRCHRHGNVVAIKYYEVAGGGSGFSSNRAGLFLPLDKLDTTHSDAWKLSIYIVARRTFVVGTLNGVGVELCPRLGNNALFLSMRKWREQ